MVDLKNLTEQIAENTRLINQAIDILDGPDVPPVIIPPELGNFFVFGDEFNGEDFR